MLTVRHFASLSISFAALGLGCSPLRHQPMDEAATPTCKCKNPLDACTPSRAHNEPPKCQRGGYHCDALNTCDPGYWCTDGTCECLEFGICGLACASNADCPGYLICAAGGICAPRRGCITDSMCSQGELCAGELARTLLLEPTANDPSLVCVKPGPLSAGHPCSANTECASGVCETSLCLLRCRQNSDCPTGLSCGEGRHSGQLGCMKQTMCSNCTKPSQFCGLGACRDGTCQSGSDCRTGSCVFGSGLSAAPNYAHCEADAEPCGPVELKVAGECFLAMPCSVDADCPATYRCLNAVMLRLCGR